MVKLEGNKDSVILNVFTLIYPGPTRFIHEDRLDEVVKSHSLFQGVQNEGKP